MCGRFTNTAGPEEIGKQIGGPLGAQIRKSAGTGRYNVAPTEQVLTIVAPEKQQPGARTLRWGLLPGHQSKTRYPLINARLETLLTDGAYAGVPADGGHRALVIADGWYEWKRPEDPKLKPQPFRFTVDDGNVFAFAGLWKDGPIPSCTIITCDSKSNRIAATIHDRMPVILADPETLRAWLDVEVSVNEALSLCGALSAGRTFVKPANPAVNNVRSPEGPELMLAPV
jgi:putative SOS response-associated peptidase YedK